MDKWLKSPVAVDPGGGKEPADKRKKDAKPKPRQYSENYILYGFTSTSADPQQPQCFFCGEVLANNSMNPAHLQRHQSTKYSESVGKTEEFYKRKLSEFKSRQTVMMKATSVSSKALEASYAVSLLVAKSKKPHSIVEELILPAAAVMAEIMIDKKAADTLKKVPLSNNTVSRRIDDMSVNIIGQVVKKMKRAGQFALQLDEMTDVSGDAQLLAFVRYKDVSDINEHILFCKKLPGKTTGEEMFQIIDSFFKEHDLQWKTCSHICTDGAAAMTGSVKGLFGHVKKVNPDIKWMHCIIHREALASKRMSPELSAVMDDAVKVINFIQSRPLNHRLFETLCHESGTEHEQLLLHTDIRWLSRGKTLLRLYELRSEVSVFLTQHLHPLAVVFEDAEWVARLAYLADVFTKLNELNLSLQGKEPHILKMYDKVIGFTKKLKLWEKKCDEGDVSCFPLLDSHLATTDVARGPVVKLVQAHLSKLCTDFSQYFQDIEEKSERLDWVRNPFIVSESCNNLPARLQEHLMDLSSDQGLKMTYAEKTLTEFWCDVEKEYPELGKHALIELLPFGSTYMCEVTFSALTHIKTKQRSRLDVKNSLVTAVSTLPPELSKLMKDKQAQVSH
uniref:SCAN domain-containing protein 3-like n=1 Tax=Epinephelus lanceolatus TaxID=310571 RepID=UPI0014461217|nr:SCAN domain-containing protein 3-like [Epinephelus lanceolatus]